MQPLAPGPTKPLGQRDLVEASEDTLTFHRAYRKSYALHNPADWDQGKIPCNMISSERLSRKSRPPRWLRFRSEKVTSLSEDFFEEDSDDWTKTILESLEQNSV